MLTKDLPTRFKGNILVVDDTPANLRLLTDMLRDKGYTVRPVLSGMEALTAALNDPPDLVMLDVNMPEMDGYEVCRRLKTHANFKDIPVIFISALTETLDKVKAFASGGVDYVTKPFQFEEVEARLNTHLQLRQALQAIRQYNDELETLLQHRTKELIRSERQAAFGQLVQGIVHNLRSPLTAASMAAEMIDAMKPPVDAAATESTEEELQSLRKLAKVVRRSAPVIATSTRKLQEMLHALLAKSRSDQSEELKTVDLNEMIRSELEFLEANLRFKHDVHKQITLSAEPLPVRVVPGEMAQVFHNIVTNALDAMVEIEHPELAIETRRWDEAVILSITDNGPGIPEDVQERIFDPFFTTKPAHEDVGVDSDRPVGTGLGLWMCRETITSYGGTIVVHSQAGQGAQFLVTLPVVSEDNHDTK